MCPLFVHKETAFKRLSCFPSPQSRIGGANLWHQVSQTPKHCRPGPVGHRPAGAPGWSSAALWWQRRWCSGSESTLVGQPLVGATEQDLKTGLSPRRGPHGGTPPRPAGGHGLSIPKTRDQSGPHRPGPRVLGFESV